MGKHWLGALIGMLAFMALSIGVTIGAGEIMRQMETREFKMVEGTIIDSHTTTSRHKNKTRYHAHVTYEYEVQGRRFTGKRFSFVAEGPDEDHRSWVASHPAGTAVNVYFDEQDPARAVLRADVNPGDFAFVAFMLALLVGCGGVLGQIGARIAQPSHAGGMMVLNLSETKRAVSLTSDTTWVVAGLVGALIVGVGTVVNGLMAATSVGMLVAGQACVIIVAVLVAGSARQAAAARRVRPSRLMVFDHDARMVFIPAGQERLEERMMPFGQIAGFEVERLELPGSKGSKIIRYQVHLEREESGMRFRVPVYRLSTRESAESLAWWCQNEVGVHSVTQELRAQAG